MGEIMKTVIRKGTVYEPVTGSFSRRDIWTESGKITEPGSARSALEIDAEGAYVLPALIDSHVHVNREDGGFGTNADLLSIPSGITVGIDAGSLGAGKIEHFVTEELPHYETLMFTLIHAASEGQDLEHAEDLGDRNIDEKEIMRLCRAYPQVIRRTLRCFGSDRRS